MRREEFTKVTQRLALQRQHFRCAACGSGILVLGEEGRKTHWAGEIGQAHHVSHAKFGGTGAVSNCVIICQSCHFSAHEGGNYRRGTVNGRPQDFEHFNG